MIYGIALILLSLLAIPSLILSKRPDAKQVLDQIAPYQGWIGLVFCVWGLWVLFRAILALKLLAIAPFWWLSWVIGGLLQFLLGFLLGYPVINQFLLSKNADAKEKGEQLMAKIRPIQEKLGLAGIAFGIWMILISLTI